MRDGWKTVQIKDVALVVNGGTPKSKVSEYWDGGVQWITPKDMGKLGSVYVSETSRTISELGLNKSSAKKFPKDSVILSTRAPIGHLAINTVSMATNQGCRALVPNEKVATKFLFYFLKASVSLLNDLGTGTTFKELAKSKLEGVQIPLPPLAEQERIVAILDQAFEGIDQAIAYTEQNLASARELFESYLNNIFTQRGDDWVEKKLGEVCENLDSKRIPITKSKREVGDIPYYGASGVVDYVKDYIFDEELLLVSEDGANLLARTYPIAFSISGKTWVNNHAHVLKFENKTSQLFVEQYLNSITLAPYVSGMAQPKLNQKALNGILIPVPPIESQEHIVSSLQSLKEQTQQLEALYTQKLESLKELKQSLLQQAFAGKLTSTKLSAGTSAELSTGTSAVLSAGDKEVAG